MARSGAFHSKQIAELEAEKRELVKMLSLARGCIAYCRRNHQDPQNGDGVPIEALIDELIERVDN